MERTVKYPSSQRSHRRDSPLSDQNTNSFNASVSESALLGLYQGPRRRLPLDIMKERIVKRPDHKLDVTSEA